jgi:PhnB protein
VSGETRGVSREASSMPVAAGDGVRYDRPHSTMLCVTPFLLFDGNCAEAMAFYQACLGGDLAITKAAETPMRAQLPPEHHQKVVNAHLKHHAVELTAADWLHPTRIPKQGNMVCIYLSGGTYDELRVIFDKLAVGGDRALLDDLRETPFGTYGHLADRYGVHWFIRGEKKP